MFVVAGSTGHTGAVVANTLLERKQPVRVLVRSIDKAAPWQARGAEAAVVALEDREALTAALQGAAGAYLLIPPQYQGRDYRAERRILSDAVAAAVQASGLQHVVFLSSIGAHLDAGTGLIGVLHDAERALRAVTPDLTLIRAAYFMENWLPSLAMARTEGVLTSFLSVDRVIPMVATSDIGRIAAECLLDRPKRHRILELSGPADYAPADVADIASRLYQRMVTVRRLPLTAVVPAFTALGASPEVARLVEEMYEGLETGRITFQGNGTCRPRGLVTLEQALRDGVPVEPTAGSRS